MLSCEHRSELLELIGENNENILMYEEYYYSSAMQVLQNDILRYDTW